MTFVVCDFPAISSSRRSHSLPPPKKREFFEATVCMYHTRFQKVKIAVFHHFFVSGRPVNPGAAYAASKAAINRLTVNWGCEWAKDGIRVNAVAPGATNTPSTESVPRCRIAAVDGRLLHFDICPGFFEVCQGVNCLPCFPLGARILCLHGRFNDTLTFFTRSAANLSGLRSSLTGSQWTDGANRTKSAAKWPSSA